MTAIVCRAGMGLPPRGVRRAASTLCVALLAAATAFAQASRWYEPYQQGVRAFERQQWEEAVRQLERAIAVDSRQAPNKYVEGTFRTNYFPHYYLGMAYLRLGRFERAEAALGRAAEGLTRELASNLESLRQQARDGLSRTPPAAAAANPQFAAALRDGDAARAAGRHADALRYYEAARAADAGEYGRQNVESRRAQSARARAGELVDEGQAALATSLRTARARFTDAERLAPGIPGANSGLAEIDRRESEYIQARASVERHLEAGNVDAARQQIEAARRAHPEQFAADGLETRVSGAAVTASGDLARLFDEGRAFANAGRYADAESRYTEVVNRDPSHRAAVDALQQSIRYRDEVRAGRTLAARQDLAGARARFEIARSLDARRFTREGLDRELTAAGGAPPGESLAGLDAPAAARPADVLRRALQSLMRGDVDGSISLLEPALAGGPTVETAALHAYLGVAYATRALSAPITGDRTRFEHMALDQFRLTLGARRDYALSPRLVSPRILELFEAARTPQR